MAGRALHQKSETGNTDYVPSGLAGTKLVGNTYHSKKLDLVGRIDEAVVMQNEVVLIERKHTDYAELKDTLRVQLGLLAILIEENVRKPVKKAMAIFSKQNRVVKYYDIDDAMREYALDVLDDARDVIQLGTLPESKFDSRCLNCCFRRICPVGSLNMDL